MHFESLANRALYATDMRDSMMGQAFRRAVGIPNFDNHRRKKKPAAKRSLLRATSDWTDVIDSRDPAKAHCRGMHGSCDFPPISKKEQP